MKLNESFGVKFEFLKGYSWKMTKMIELMIKDKHKEQQNI